MFVCLLPENVDWGIFFVVCVSLSYSLNVKFVVRSSLAIHLNRNIHMVRQCKIGFIFIYSCSKFLWYISGNTFNSQCNLVTIAYPQNWNQFCFRLTYTGVLETLTVIHSFSFSKSDSFIVIVQRTVFRHRESGKNVLTQIWMIWRLSRRLVCLFYDLYILLILNTIRKFVYAMAWIKMYRKSIANEIPMENFPIKWDIWSTKKIIFIITETQQFFFIRYHLYFSWLVVAFKY